MLKAKQGKICKNYSHVKRFNTQGVYAHGQAVSFIIRHNTFIYLHMFQKKLNEVRCGAILCDHRSYHVLFRGFDRFWMVLTRAKIRQLPRSISGKFVMLHWCVLGPFAEEPLGLQLHPAIPARSQLKPSQSFTSHHVPLRSIATLYFHVFLNVSFKQLPRRSKKSPGYQCLLLNNEFLLFFLPRTWHDLTNCRNGGKAHFDSLGVTWCHHASHNFVTFFGVTQYHILDHIRQIDTKKKTACKPACRYTNTNIYLYIYMENIHKYIYIFTYIYISISIFTYIYIYS